MRPLGAARVATAALFAICGVGSANWVVRIPDVKEDLDLGTGPLGVALLGLGLGSLLSMPATGWLVARVGSRPVSGAMGLAYCAALALPGFAPNLPALIGALLIFGAATGSLDVAMNAQAVAVERRYQRTILSSFHALFSIGGLAGALVGGVVASAGVSVEWHLLATGGLLAVVVLLAWARLLPASADAASHEPSFGIPSRALLGPAVIAFCVLMAEGAMADWSAVYLRDEVETGPGMAAAGFAVFSLTMAAGRLAGDRLADRFGPVLLVRGGGVGTAVGLALALLTATPAGTLIGLGFVGLGLSFIFPIVLSAVSQAPGMAPSVAIATIATSGYFGFLVGPPLIGFAGELVTLRGGLAIVVLLGVVTALLARSVGRRGEVASGAPAEPEAVAGSS